MLRNKLKHTDPAARVSQDSDSPPDTTPVTVPPLVLGGLHVPIPIVQGGMGVGVSLARLASSVANAGAVGVISAVGIGMMQPGFAKDFLGSNIRALRSEIQRARQMTNGVLGVNVMVALTDYGQYVRAAVDEGIDVVFSGAGLPVGLPGFVPPGAKTKLVPIVSSGRAAALICRKWQSRYQRLPDGFVVEGPLAGGHLGFSLEQISDPAYSLERLVEQTIDQVRPFAEQHGVNIPIIAAGGIYSGRDMRRFLEMGAAAVQMGTRFVATEECEVSDAFKAAYVACREEDITIIRSPVGMPGRALRSEFTEAIMRGERMPLHCPFKCISSCAADKSPYCIALALLNAKRGDLGKGFAFAGANAYRIDRIISVKELIATLLEEYCEAGSGCGSSLEDHG